MSNKKILNGLFPVINPLKRPKSLAKFFAGEPPFIKREMMEHYRFILPEKYITDEKLYRALFFLRSNYRGTMIERATKYINSELEHYKQSSPKTDLKGVSYFWVCVACEFIFYNEYIKAKNAIFLNYAQMSFLRARLYKEPWIARAGQRDAAKATNKEKADIRRDALEIVKRKCKNDYSAELNYELFITEFNKLYSEQKAPFGEKAFARRDNKNPLVQAKFI